MNYFYCSYAIGDWVFHFYIRIQIHHFNFIFHPKKQEGRFCRSISVVPKKNTFTEFFPKTFNMKLGSFNF